MAISYNRMWKLLVDKKMSKADLRKAADIAPNTMVTASVLKLRKPFYSSLPVTTNFMWWTSILTMDGLVRILTDQHFSE